MHVFPFHTRRSSRQALRATESHTSQQALRPTHALHSTSEHTTHVHIIHIYSRVWELRGNNEFAWIVIHNNTEFA